MGGNIAIKGYAMAVLLLVVGGLAWGFMAIKKGVNPVEKLLGRRWAAAVYVLVGLSALLVVWVGRNAFLPFLGPTVFPCAVLEERVPEGADTTLKIHTQPGAKVMYWAAEPVVDADMGQLKDWRGAYAGFHNVGVCTADDVGLALLQVRKPQAYTVPMKGALQAHVHYRVCLPDGGLDEVRTVFLEGASEEGFQVAPVAAPTMQVQPPMPPPPMPPIVVVAAPAVQPQQPMPPVAVVAAPAVQPQPHMPPAVVVAAPAVQPLPATPLPAPPAPTVPATPPPVVQKPAAKAPSASPEGFTSDIVYGNADVKPVAAIKPLTLTVDVEVDPRVQQLRSTVESDASSMFAADANGFEEGPAHAGTELDLAFSEPKK